MDYRDTKRLKFDTKVEQYTHDNDWIIIIRGSNNGREAWLQHKDYGISMLMFAAQTTFANQFMALVDRNLDEYKKLYLEEFCDH